MQARIIKEGTRPARLHVVHFKSDTTIKGSDLLVSAHLLALCTTNDSSIAGRCMQVKSKPFGFRLVSNIYFCLSK